MNNAYLTIEDTTGSSEFPDVANQILEEFDNMELALTDSTEYYFVIKISYDDYEDIQDLVSTTAYILAGANITRYTTTINCI